MHCLKYSTTEVKGMNDIEHVKKVYDMGFNPHKIYYHGTTSKEPFDTFKHSNGDIGFHFGTLKQATERLKDKPSEHSDILKVHLKLHNPLRLRDISHFSTQAVKHELESHPMFQSNQHQRQLAKIKTDDHLRSYLQNQGYDGIVYRNEKEVPEAASHIKQANLHLSNFVAATKSSPYKVSKEHQQHPEYVNYLKEMNRAAQMVDHFADDSYIVFNPNQIRKTTATFDKDRSHSGNINESN